MQLKIGDRAKVLSKIGNHGFQIGEIIEILETYPESANPHYRARNESGDEWWIDEEEVGPHKSTADKEQTKKNLIPFDLEKWQAGAKPFTRDEREVKQLTYFEGSDGKNLVGLVVVNLLGWFSDGRYSRGKRDTDLMLEQPPVKQYVNVYPDRIGGARDTLEACKQLKDEEAIGWLEITITGEGAHSEFFPID